MSYLCYRAREAFEDFQIWEIAFKICLNCSFKITYILVSVFGVIWTRRRF